MLLRFIKHLLGRAAAPPSGFGAAYRLYEQGALDAAERACRSCADAPVADRDFLLGLIAEKRGDLSRAVDHMHAAVEARPHETSFRYAYARALRALGRGDAAVEQLELIVELAGENDMRTAAALLLADVHGERSHIDAARAVFGRIPEADRYPVRVRRTMMLPAIYASRADIAAARERFEAELDALLAMPAETTAAPEKKIGVLPFYLAYHNANNAELLRKASVVMRRACEPHHPYPAERRARGDRMRVGFVSTYFYSHSVARITLGLVRDLPRERFSVDVFAIEPNIDPWQRDIETAADSYIRLPAKLDAVRDAIGRAALDVLVFADIGMHPLTYFLALSRLAPVQLVWWGHPETTGIDTIDYFLCSRAIAPAGAERLYTERLLRPDAFFLPGYTRPRLGETPGRAALGLPADAHVYACLQPLFKLHPDIDAVFGEILERDAKARIVLLESRPAWALQIRARFEKTLGPHAARVLFLPPMPHARFMATLAAADVSLDPLYFGGGNSTCEALAVSVPVVTLPGDHIYGRLSAALCSEIGLDELVASSPQDYAARALRLACDRDYRMSVKARIDSGSARLFDREDFTLAFAETMARGFAGAGGESD